MEVIAKLMINCEGRWEGVQNSSVESGVESSQSQCLAETGSIQIIVQPFQFLPKRKVFAG